MSDRCCEGALATEAMTGLGMDFSEQTQVLFFYCTQKQ
jgi:hypothetical protein